MDVAWVSIPSARPVGADGSRAEPATLEAGIASDALGGETAPAPQNHRVYLLGGRTLPRVISRASASVLFLYCARTRAESRGLSLP
jgi:hypothetical protein